MANVYGSRNKNQFKLSSVEKDETYYTLVNPENGEITLKRINKLIIDSSVAQNFDPIVGTIPATGPNKGKFIPNTGSTTIGVSGATQTEIKAFAQQPQAVQQVKNKAIETSNNAQKDLGVDQKTRESRTNEILDTGQASTSTTGDPIGGEGTTANDSTVNTGSGFLSGASIKTEGRSVKDYPENNLLRYPLNMSGKQDCITFTMLEYAPRKFSSSSSDFAKGEAQSKRAGFEGRRGKTVTLPIQPTVSDSNVVKWGAEDMNALQAVAAAAAMSTIEGGPEAAAAAVTGASDFITGKGNSSLKALIATGFAEQAAQVKGLLTRATGGILNPNTELLFQGPDLRSFNFNFSLSAREPQEAIQIKNIIRFFKQGMSVKRADTALFLKSPHTFEIKYLFNGKEHPWINKIKECALVSCIVNYTPAGNYATYEDGSMTQYDISLSFSELEPIYDDDYAEADKAIGGGLDSSIGY